MSRILIRDGMVLSGKGWLRPGYVVVNGPKIEQVSPGVPQEGLLCDDVISLQNKAVLPGLVNSHTHLSQSFMRGLSGGRTLISWLKERIWPLQGAMSVEELRLAALLGLTENLRCGVTHVVNHHKIATTPKHTDALLRSALESKLNVTIARGWVDKGTNAEPVPGILEDLERLFGEWHHAGGERITIANGPLSTWRISEQTLKTTHEMAKTHASFSHIHVSENYDEVKMCLESTGLTPVHWLDSLGVLDRSTQIVHAVWVNEPEMDKIAERGATIVHCPLSNAVLGSGIAPLAQLKKRGIPIRIATDGPASNDNQDLWEDIKSALAFARATTMDPLTVTPEDALNMALSAPCLEAGGKADLIAVALDHPRAVPVYDPTSALVLCSSGPDVELVMVAGEVLMKHKKVLVLDEKQLLKECQEAAKGLYRRAGIEIT